LKRTSRSKFPRITAALARQALHVLISEGRLTAKEVMKAVRRRQGLLRELRQRLAMLGEEASGEVVRAVKAARLSSREKATNQRRTRKPASRAQRAAWAAQGRYMAAVRRLPKAKRAKVKAIREKSGVAAAIREAGKLTPSR